MNIVTINVNGIEYKLKGEETKEYLNSIAKEVDDKIRDMMSSNKNFTLHSASILLSINYCDQIHKLNREKDELIESISKCNDKIQSLINENSELKSRMIELENNKEELEVKNSKLEEELEAFNIILKQDGDKIFSDNNEIQQLEEEIEMLKDTIKKLKSDKNRHQYRRREQRDQRNQEDKQSQK